jgi:hypothetical protein
MFLYFYLLEEAFYHEVMVPTLTEALRRRAFEPCWELCRRLIDKSSLVPGDALVRRIPTGFRFARAFWHALIGECLLYGAVDIPRLEIASASLLCLLAPAHGGEPDPPRAAYTPIEKCLYGTRDLAFGGGYYRPDFAGFNNAADVEELTLYLETVDPAQWQPGDLQRLVDCANDEERALELDDARASWPSLVELYQTAQRNRWMIVCERI